MTAGASAERMRENTFSDCTDISKHASEERVIAPEADAVKRMERLFQDADDSEAQSVRL